MGLANSFVAAFIAAFMSAFMVASKGLVFACISQLAM
jgi:hypothetical protein